MCSLVRLLDTFKTAIAPAPQGSKDIGNGFGSVTVVSVPVMLKVVAKKEK